MRVVMIVLNDMTSDARVSREATTLARVGHKVWVLALRAKGLPECEQTGDFEIRRVADFTTASALAALSKASQSRTRTRALAQSAVALEPDVIHAHDTTAMSAGARAAADARAALVYDAHELYPDSLTQQRIQGTWPVQVYWRSLESRLIPKADAVVTVSDGLREVLWERFGVKAVVVANAPVRQPMSDRDVLREELGIGHRMTIVLYQGGLFAGRALRELVEAVTRVPDVALVVQGQGPEEPAMREHVVALGIEERTYFMGQVPQADLYRYTCGADIGTVFLDGVTLNHRLAWPNRLFMYFMAGIPSVVTDLPGMSSLVRGSRVGLTTPAGDVGAMASAMAKLVADPALRDEMGVRARVLAETRFNWESEACKLVDLYRGLQEARS